jgi:hypothetical protein
MPLKRSSRLCDSNFPESAPSMVDNHINLQHARILQLPFLHQPFPSSQQGMTRIIATSQLKPQPLHDNTMRFVRNGSGSPSIVCLILSLLSIGIVYAASIPAPRRDSASIAGNLNRRADSSPADADSPYDYGTPPLWSLESEQPDVNYPAFIAAGGTLDEAMRKNTDTLEADLIATDKLPKGQQLASQFTDPSAFESNGWKQDDRTPDLDQFALYAPITTSLQSLGISTSGWPSGNNHFTSYQHTLPWQHEGQEMKVSQHSNSL